MRIVTRRSYPDHGYCCADVPPGQTAIFDQVFPDPAHRIPDGFTYTIQYED